MFVLLPPSETKAVGGRAGMPTIVGFPALDPARRLLLDALATLSADLPAARSALGVTAAKDAEITANAALATAPTLPALHRYTGVLYDALDITSLGKASWQRAQDRILIGSALFGLVRAADRIPAYRLSAGSHLPGLPRLAAFWRPQLAPVLAGLSEPVLDLRSGAYAAFAPVPGAITVRVPTENAAGARSVVSHFSKATKGLLARALVDSRAGIADTAGVVRVARRAGLRVEKTGPLTLDVIT
ncbi:peroxide stress protein YaaA [Nakamurella flavida]|uniref:Peroxide stress protein YaaA n=1 Tax=Nakamurella flavida TaxID=363630 RepID=A0A938YQJ6_9ACTN|nr:peroxide stress protein YaaA [Nakamurella flavida]MBM9477130.1 peroxide stress protein YaaA [Nakamurella flavida]MDP9780076.1 cytoplasmic iron level regulating protein YaaA (DUF328/UPF0246 family) [Nakamurella flavida]